MSEATVQPVLAATTVSEQSRDLVQNFKEFYDRHHIPIGIAVVMGFAVFVNRALIRRELTRLRFTVEVVSADGLPDLTELTGYTYDD